MVAIAVIPLTDVDPELLAFREERGLDRFDEVWDGVLHMVPPPHDEHVQIGVRLIAFLFPLTEAAGLLLGYEEGLIPPEEPGWNNYRVPDLMVFRPAIRTHRGAEGAADLVIEIRSPGDESFEKLPFYEHLGTREALIIDRRTKAIRRWAHDGEQLVEFDPDARGRHQLTCLPVELWTAEEALHLQTLGTAIRI